MDMYVSEVDDCTKSAFLTNFSLLLESIKPLSILPPHQYFCDILPLSYITPFFFI